MARFTGPQHKGATRAHKDRLRADAAQRDAATLPGRRRRRDRPDRAPAAANAAPGAVYVRPIDDDGAPTGEWQHVGHLTGLHLDPADDDADDAPIGAVHAATLALHAAFPPRAAIGYGTPPPSGSPGTRPASDVAVRAEERAALTVVRPDAARTIAGGAS